MDIPNAVPPSNPEVPNPVIQTPPPLPPLAETPPITTSPTVQQTSGTVVTGMMGKPKSDGFRIFIMLSIVLIAAIWGFVGYLFYKNKTAKTTQIDTATVAQDMTVTPTPLPEFSPSEIQISNGDVARVTAFGETKTLVKKEDYPATGITGFARVVVSPDNAKLCFESIPPAINPALYVSKVDGTEVIEIEKNRNTCTWLDSEHIAYVDSTIGKTRVDILRYHLEDKVEENLTANTGTKDLIRQYLITGFVDNKIQCHYNVVNATGKKLSESNCEVDLGTLTVTDIAL